MAAAIACIPLVGGIVFYILEKHDTFVRFYAMQSIIFGCAWFLFNIVSAVVHAVFGAIPGIGGILVFFWAIIAALVHLAFLVVMIIAIVKAFTGLWRGMVRIRTPSDITMCLLCRMTRKPARSKARTAWRWGMPGIFPKG